MKAPHELSGSMGANRGRPWGFWATIGFSSIVVAAYLIIGIVVVVAFVIVAKVQNPEMDIATFSKSLSSNGLCLTVAIILSTPICTALVVLFAKLRKSYPIRDYLGFTNATRRGVVKWLLATAALIAFSDALTHLLNRPIVPAFMVDVYKTAFFTPILYVAFILLAPIFEEVFFRGFVFQGIRYSRLGPMGAIGLTAIGWSILHIQYDAYGMVSIFALGLLLGTARLKTDSVYLTSAMHSLMNLVATIEAGVYVKFFG